jgi:hypothetical protein
VWIDGTDSGNINCGSGSGGDGCNLWVSGEPKYVNYIHVGIRLSVFPFKPLCFSVPVTRRIPMKAMPRTSAIRVEDMAAS